MHLKSCPSHSRAAVCFSVLIITIRKSCGKVLFSQTSRILSTGDGGGDVHVRGCVVGGMYGGGVHDRGHAWQDGHAWHGTCVAGAMHGRRVCMAGACMAGGMHGRGFMAVGGMCGMGRA